MATVKYIIKATSNKIQIEIDDSFIGKELFITVTDKKNKPKSYLEIFSDPKYTTIDLTRKPNESVIDDVPDWNTLSKKPKEDRPNLNTNIIEDEPNWNSNTPLDKDLDIFN